MALDILALKSSKKYTDETVVGGGAIKGKNCTIEDIVKVDGINTVTFKWTLDDGTEKTADMEVADGLSITNLEVDKNGKLVATLSDGSKLTPIDMPTAQVAVSKEKNNVATLKKDGIYVPKSGGAVTYTNEEGVAQDIGGIAKGTTFKDTPIEEVLDKLFAPPYEKPQISIGLSCKNLYDKNGTDIPTSITITANVTKKTEEIAEVSAYIGTTLIEKKTEGVKDGGKFTFTYTVPADFETSMFKVECKDSKNTVNTTSKVTLVALSYQGCIADGVTIDETAIKALTPVLKATVGGTYEYTTPYGRFLHAIPSEIGDITSAKDLVNNFNYTDSCTKTTMTINGETYNVWYLTDAMGFDGVKITFA